MGTGTYSYRKSGGLLEKCQYFKARAPRNGNSAAAYFTRVQVCLRQIGPTQPETSSLLPESAILDL